MAKNNKKSFWDEDDDVELVVKDCNGNILNEGDTVFATKDLKVKGGKDIKRGDKFQNIRLTDNEEEIECGSGKNTMVLKTCYFKKG